MLLKDNDYFETPELSEWDRLRVECLPDGKHFRLKFFQANRWEGVAISSSSWNARRWFAHFPEHKDSQAKGFAGDVIQVPITDITIQLILSWPKEKRSFEEEAKQQINAVAMSLVSQQVAATVSAEFKLNGKVPEKFNYDLHSKYPLRDHQKVALYNAMISPGYALFMEQGTGKTPVGVAAICNAAKRRLNKNKKFAAIVVCPKAVRTNWANEFKHFATTCGKVTIIRGNEIERIKCFADAFKTPKQAEFTVVICNYETLQRSWTALQIIKWDMAILDESHFIKSFSTKRFKYAIKLRDNASKRIILTGTPITNSALDLYTQFEFLGEGFSGFGSWSAFKKFYGVFEATGGGFSKLVGMQNVPFLKDRLARLSFMCRREEVLKDLPPKLYTSYEVNMTAKQTKVYNDMLTNLQAKFDSISDSDTNAMTVNHMLTQLLRLSQITSGFVKLDDEVKLIQDPETGDWVEEVVKEGKVVQIPGVNPKLDAIEKLAKELGPEEKMIVWTCFREDVRAIKERLDSAGIHSVYYQGGMKDEEQEYAKSEYNTNPNCKVLIGNSKSGGTGLNLLGYDPKAADPIDCNTTQEWFYSQNFSVTDRLQSEDRACRDGQRVPVSIGDLVVPCSIDEEIRARVEAKKINAIEISDVKNILQGLLAATLEVNGNGNDE